MKTLDVIQGSDEWLAARALRHTASQAPAMMGASPYQSRDDLLREKATGIGQEFDDATHARFNAGHEAEASARAIAERILGAELFPVTVVSDDDRFLASLDGLTMDDATAFEHKLWNEELAAQVRAGYVPDGYAWQLDQIILVTGCARILFVVSDGTEDRWVSTIYTPNAERLARLVAGWDQFDADLATWAPQPEFIPAKGKAPDSLPALILTASGMVTASNLPEFRSTVMAVLDGINRELVTDVDFGNAEQTVKWCKDLEERIELQKGQIIAQMQTVDDAVRALDAIRSKARDIRLELDKLVEREKLARRNEIVAVGVTAVREHYVALAVALGEYAILPPQSLQLDMAAQIKGKKSLTSMRDAVNAAAANMKIAATQTSDRVRANMRLLRDNADHGLLFPDHVALAQTKQTDDLRNLIAARIAEHDRREAEKAAELAKQQQAELVRVEERAAAEPPHVAQPIPMRTAQALAADPEAAPESPSITLTELNAWIAPLAIDITGCNRLGLSTFVDGKHASSPVRISGTPEKILRALFEHLGAVLDANR